VTFTFVTCVAMVGYHCMAC